MMWRSILMSQWVYSRAALLFLVVVAFTAPLAAIAVLPTTGRDPATLLVAGEGAGYFVLFAVGIAALALGVHGWSIDAEVRHVYALSLPISRARYAWYRLVAVCTLVSAVVASSLLGALCATALVQLPDTLRAYPFSLALRALLSGWLIACTTMALFAFARERLKLVILSVLVLGGLLLVLGTTRTDSLLASLWEALRSNPGPLGVLLGRWTLIDV